MHNKISLYKIKYLNIITNTAKSRLREMNTSNSSFFFVSRAKSLHDVIKV